MKKIVFLIIALLLVQSVFALSASEARQEWKDLKEASREKKETHQEAKVDFSLDKTDENRQRVVDTGKDVLHAALDEAEAWLVWKDIEANVCNALSMIKEAKYNNQTSIFLSRTFSASILIDSL